MNGFQQIPSLDQFRAAYPTAAQIQNACKFGGERAQKAIVRQWLTEGVPFIFRSKPGLYEEIRDWIAMRLDINAKEISLVGSARLGESLAPKKLGNPLGINSDLDLFTVSSKLFDAVRQEANNWIDDFRDGRCVPRDRKQESNWPANVITNERNIRRGFLDTQKIPSMPNYPNVKNVNNTSAQLVRRLEQTDGVINIKKASMRCYRDWDACTRQCIINITSNDFLEAQP